MKHLGDITKLNGAKIPPVWVITGGSPCQDLSVAGKRAGLAGARSGLYMEQIRVIKEMRQHDRDCGRTGVHVRPRYMVWENVPGAFSSNKGEDFRAVLEEAAHVSDESAAIPGPPNGKWPTAGCVMGSGWSLAWRVMDAQYWGVPQRRRRIALVADFGGQSAPEILFERKGVSGDIAESGTAGKGITADAERSTGKAIGVKCLNPSFPQSARVYDADGVWHSLNANENGGQSRDAILYEPKSAYEENWAEADVKNALRAEASKSSHAIEFDARGNGEIYCCEDIPHMNPVKEMSPCLSARGYKSQNYVASADCRNIRTGHSVRRLTPLECERLQGYPDGWTDIGEWTDSKGKVHKPSDSTRYKALGNSIALPQWRYVLGNIAERLPHGAELGSLFDGIGGFPLVWSEINGEEACLWASEIEEFPISVTKRWFPEGGENDKIDRHA